MVLQCSHLIIIREAVILVMLVLLWSTQSVKVFSYHLFRDGDFVFRVNANIGNPVILVYLWSRPSVRVLSYHPFRGGDSVITHAKHEEQWNLFCLGLVWVTRSTPAFGDGAHVCTVDKCQRTCLLGLHSVPGFFPSHIQRCWLHPMYAKPEVIHLLPFRLLKLLVCGLTSSSTQPSTNSIYISLTIPICAWLLWKNKLV